MGVVFRPRINWPKNELLLPARLYGVQVPAGLADIHVRDPKYVNSGVMFRLSRSNELAAWRYGLVDTDLKVTFRHPAAQWHRSPPGGRDTGHGPYVFQFTGGDVFLDLDLAIYILDIIKPNPTDDVSVKVFALAYDHELLHVIDEVNIIHDSHLIAEIMALPPVQMYLVRAQPFVYGTPQQSAAELSISEFVNKGLEYLKVAIVNKYTVKHNEATARRDTQENYRRLQQKIDELRTGRRAHAAHA